MILGGCALTPHRSEVPTWPQALERLLPTEILLLGERHDAPQHQDMQRQTVQWLAQRGLLAALVMEMAEAGRSTQGLAPQASEAEVQTALGWSEALWPWQNYGPVAMAAVQAGVPVLGIALHPGGSAVHHGGDQGAGRRAVMRTGAAYLCNVGHVKALRRREIHTSDSVSAYYATRINVKKR